MKQAKLLLIGAAVLAFGFSAQRMQSSPLPQAGHEAHEAAAKPAKPAGGGESHEELVEHGAKVAKLCDTCHTLRGPDGKPVVGAFGGGKPLAPNVVSANITNSPSGISYFTEDMLHTALREGRVGARKLHVMTPALFKKLSDDDIHAVWTYLRQVPPVDHRVDNTEEPTYCKKCRQKHGDGDLN